MSQPTPSQSRSRRSRSSKSENAVNKEKASEESRSSTDRARKAGMKKNVKKSKSSKKNDKSAHVKKEKKQQRKKKQSKSNDESDENILKGPNSDEESAASRGTPKLQKSKKQNKKKRQESADSSVKPAEGGDRQSSEENLSDGNKKKKEKKEGSETKNLREDDSSPKHGRKKKRRDSSGSKPSEEARKKKKRRKKKRKRSRRADDCDCDSVRARSVKSDASKGSNCSRSSRISKVSDGSQASKASKARNASKGSRASAASNASKASKESKDSKGSRDSQASHSGSGDKGKSRGRRRKRRHRRRRTARSGRSGSGSRSRSHSRSRRRGRRSRRRRSRSDDDCRGFYDARPMVERAKGGVKLFVGRLPLEATSSDIQKAFEEFGEVVEVFLIDPARGQSGARCAFVRLSSLSSAEKAIEDMHEKRILVSDRAELGPIQVAFAKGEATRFGLDAGKEQLPARWQIPQGKPTDGLPGKQAAADPECLSKDGLVSLVKEGQRSGGQAFKQQWWTYCDSGKGGVQDYDPQRHPHHSLKQFIATAQQGEWGSAPWFRRGLNLASMGWSQGPRTRGGRRRRRRQHGHSSSSYRSSRSSSSSSSTTSNARRNRLIRNKQLLVSSDGAIAAAVDLAATLPQPVGEAGSMFGMPAGMLPFDPERPPPPPPLQSQASARPAASLGALLRGAQPQTSAEDAAVHELADKASASKPAWLLAPASERNVVVDYFLTKHKISPVTSFQMLKLSSEQAVDVVAHVEKQLPLSPNEADAERLVTAKLKELGIRTGTFGGGSWTSTQRTERLPSPGSQRMPAKDKGLDGILVLDDDQRIDTLPAPQIGQMADLPSVEGELSGGVADVEETRGLRVRAESPIPPPPPLEADSPPPPPPTTSAAVAEEAVEETGGAYVFVKNLDKGTGEREIRDLFSKHGSVSVVDIPRDKDTALGKGHAFVRLCSREEADRCVRALNFTKPWGRALVVERLRAEGEDQEDEKKTDKIKSSEPVTVTTKIVSSGRAKSSKRGSSSDSGSSSRVAKKTKTDTKKKESSSAGGSSSRPSRGRNRSKSSGWSRYTVRSKSGARRKGRGRRKRKSARGRRRRRKRKSRCKSGSSSSSSGDSSSDSSNSGDERDVREAAIAESMGWPSHAPPMFPPGMHPGQMMPPPWGMPWGGMPPSMLDERGFPVFDRDEAERLLMLAEQESMRQMHHPRMDEKADAHRSCKFDRRKPSKSGSRCSCSSSRIRQRENSSEASSVDSSSFRRRRRRIPSQQTGRHPPAWSRGMPLGMPARHPHPGWIGHGPPVMVPPAGLSQIPTFGRPEHMQFKRGPKRKKQPEEVDESDDSDDDLSNEINFADI